MALGGGSGLEVGSVFARVGALFDDDGFEKFRREVKRAREEAKGTVEPNLQADFNASGFDKFGRALKEAKADSVKPVEPNLGADYNSTGFSRFTRAIRAAREDGIKGVKTELRADVDQTGFRQYDRALQSARRESDITTHAGIRTKAGFIGVGKSAGVAALGFLGTYGLVEGVRTLFTAYRESEKVGKQTEAVIKSTGGEARVTATHVGDLATKFSELGAVDDEMVQSGENVLLTFTNIRNEVGRGNNIFDQASLAALNMSVALDQDLKGSAIQLGKALNDPIKGITALSRVGVSFTESTKERITALVEDGKTMAAQKIILRELNKEFGGSVKAAGEGASGFDKLKVSAENLEESIGSKLAPSLSSAAGTVADFFDSLSGSGSKGGKNEAGATVRRIVGEVGKQLSGFKNEASDLWQTAKRIFTGIGDVLEETFGGKSEIGPDLEKIGKALRGFGEWALRAYNTVAKRALPGIITAFRGFAQIIRGVVRVITGILTLDFGKAWEGVKDIFSGAIKLIGGELRAATAPFRELAARAGGAIADGFGAAVDAIEGVFKGVGGFILRPIKGAIDAALGYVSSFLGTLGDIGDAVSGIPGVGAAFDGVSGSIHDAQDSIDSFRESMRKSDDEQDNAVKASKRQVAALKAERRQLRENSASHDDLRRNKRQLREAQDALNRSTKAGESRQKSAARVTGGWGSQLRILTGRTKEAKGGTDNLNRSTKDQAGSNSFSKGLRRMIRGSGNFQSALGRATDFVKEATNKALKGFGAKPLDWVVNAAKDVGDLLGFARGGFIGGKRGAKGSDKRLVLAGDGEAFFNGDQIPYVEQALRKTYGVNLPQFFGSRSWRPHQQTRGYAQGGVVGNLPAMVSEAGRIDSLHEDYVWGGSHGISPTPPNGPFDCSSAVSHILQSGGYSIPTMVSGQLASWGAPGPGPVTIFANPEHTFMRLGTRYWGTSSSNPGGGPGWIPAPDSGYLSGFQVRHPTGVGGGQIPNLKIAGPAGPQRTILQGSADAMVKQANAYIQKNAGLFGGDSNLDFGHMSEPQIESVWAQANPGEGDKHLMAAIAMQESSGDPSVTNSIGARGLWQIIPSTASAFGLNYDRLTDPLYNAEGAGRILAGQGLTAWEGYTDGGYAKYMSEGGIVESFKTGGVVGGKSGKKGSAKKAPKVTLGGAEAAGPIHVSTMGPLEAQLGRDGGNFVGVSEGQVSDLEGEYSYWDRRFNLSEEEFIVEDDAGAPVLNKPAIERRVGELRRLLEIRRAIVAVRMKEIAYAKRTMELIRPVIAQLKQGLRSARGAEQKKKWGAAVTEYAGKYKGWKSKLTGWRSDSKERNLDVDEVKQQIDALLPGGAIYSEADKQAADFLAGQGDPGEAAGGGNEASESEASTGEAAPTPEQIAAAASEQIATFQAERASLYGEFGRNFVGAGGNPFGSSAARAAGMAYFGAASGMGSADVYVGGLPPVETPVGEAEHNPNKGKNHRGVTLIQTFNQPPPDPHAWTKSALFELGASF